MLLLYPEAAQSDFVQDVSEHDLLIDHLLEMFGEHAENSPPWDSERAYRAKKLNAYVSFPSDDDEREVWSALRVDTPLGMQLVQKHRLGYEVPGIPIVQVVLRGSTYERRLFSSKDRVLR